MLKIWIGKHGLDYIHSPGSYFNFTYDPKWIETDFSRKVIDEIDKSDVLMGGRAVYSRKLDAVIPITSISGGTKALILMMFDESGKIFNATACGDNCFPYIEEIAKVKDLSIRIGNCENFSKEQFERGITVLNNGKTVYSERDYIIEYGDFISEK